MSSLRLAWAACAAAFVAICAARTACAHAGGVTTSTEPLFDPTQQGCAHGTCHSTSSGSAPTVTFRNVPATMAKGTHATLYVDVKPASGDARNTAGFNASVSGSGSDLGVLSALAGAGDVQAAGNQVTHTQPKSAPAGQLITFAFDYRAPATCGVTTLAAWGNLVNSNFAPTGDYPVKTTAPSITTCGPGAPCSTTSDCNAGLTCVDNVCCTVSACSASSTPCHVNQCQPLSAGVNAGKCVNVAAPNGTSCDDGNVCTTNDSCSAGSCTASSPVVCNESPDPCYTNQGTCTSPAGCQYTTPSSSGTYCGGQPNQQANEDYACNGSGACIGTPRPAANYVWGSSTSHGGLGLGTLGATASTPTPLTTTDELVQVASSGEGYTVALAADGSVWGWGFNQGGGLGDGTKTDRPSPVQITSLSQFFTAVAVGDQHTLALRSDGAVFAWGYNGTGATAVPPGSDPTVPNQVKNLYGVIAIAAGDNHSVALRADGTVWTWGANDLGQLGIGNTAPPTSSGPVQVVSSMRFRAIAAGADHTLAIGVDGKLYGWGDNSDLQLGGTSTAAVPSVKDTGVAGVRAIAAGKQTSFAVDYSGKLRSWGRNDFGQLGHGDTTPSGGAAVALVQNLSNVVAVSTKVFHTAALLADGTVWTWGNNSVSALGDPTRPSPDPTPKKVSGVGDVLSVSVGYATTTTVRALGNVATWGFNGPGMLGIGKSYSEVPDATSAEVVTKPAATATTPGLATFRAISASGCTNSFYVHNLALSGDGKVWAWGSNSRGQLGQPTSVSESDVPMYVALPAPAIAVAAGCQVSGAVTADGNMYFWGYGGDGTLATGNTNDSSTPVLFPGTPAAVTIAMKGTHVLMLNITGHVYTWGNNAHLQLGRTGGNALSPPTTYVRFPNSLLVRGISAGITDSYAILADGTVAAWGGSAYLGTGAAIGDYVTPARVSDLGNVTEVATDAFTTASVSGGMIYSWGDGSSGQFGDSSAPSTLSLPMNMLPLPWLKKVASSAYDSYALAVSGDIVGAGVAQSGALCSGSTTTAWDWVGIPAVHHAVAVDAAYLFGMAIIP